MPTRIEVARPQYLLKALDSIGAEEWQGHRDIRSVFSENTPGIITSRDHFSIAFTPVELTQRVSRLIDPRLTDETVAREYKLGDTRGWSLSDARRALREAPDWKRSLRPMLQAPFDLRWLGYDIRLVDWGRWAFVRRLTEHDIGICLSRKIDIQTPWEHVFVADVLISHHAVSMKEVNYFFPLMIDGRENLSADFRAFIDSCYEHHYTPEEILGYIYAVLHAPTYRARYAEFLRIDFPRVPFPEAAEDFETLSGLGWALIQAHLLRELSRRGLGDYQGRGDHRVEAVRYSPAEEAIWINKTQSFRPVPQEVWDFRIGGYQVPRQIPEIAPEPRAVARRDQSCRCHRRQPDLYDRADGEDRRSLSVGISRADLSAKSGASRPVGA